MKKFGFFLAIFGILIFLAFNKHSKDHYKGYHSVIWADAAGYYVYNPLWFVSTDFPIDSTIQFKTGNGFFLNHVSGKIETKYTSGVALMEVPFFLIAHLISNKCGFSPNGFSKIYYWAIMIAAIFYGLLGLLFSFTFLLNHFSKKDAAIAVSVIFLSTNLYYYTLDNSGMSHVYSFFLFSSITLISTNLFEAFSFKKFSLFFLCFYLAVLIRPTNFIVIFFVLLYNLKNRQEIIRRINYFKTYFVKIVASALAPMLVFLPQILYWQKTFGNSIVYTYKNEGFSNLLHPKLLYVWFSTNNGLFVYSPIILLSIASLIILLKQKDSQGISVVITFCIASYIFASWWDWQFGCAYGARSFVEYYALLVYPLAYLFSITKTNSKRAFLLSFCLFCIFLNLNIIYYYDGCFYGGIWDWSQYLKLHTK